MRLLVVDDDRHLLLALKRGLVAEGFAVDVALDGVEAQWYAQENSYDAMVLDIMLPGLNGYELCAQLREVGDWTPILMLTAKAGSGDEPGRSTPAPTTSCRNRFLTSSCWPESGLCCVEVPMSVRV